MAQIDSLELTITTKASSCIAELTKLSNTIGAVSTKLSTLNGNSLNNLASGVTNLSNALSSIPSSDNIKGIASSLRSLSKVSSSTIVGASNSLKTLATSVSGISNVGEGASQVSTLAKSIAKLGGKNVTTAVSNIPKLTRELKLMFAELSRSPQISASVIKMTEALANLSRSLGGVRQASTGSSKGLDLFSNSVSRAKTSSKGLASAIGKIYATYWLLFRAFSVFRKSIDLSSSLTEIQNVVEHTFAQATDKFNAFSKSAKDSLGMSELVAKQIGSRYQAMGVAMDISAQSMAKANKRISELTKGYNDASNSASGMSITLTKLAGDMASFYDTEQTDVAEDLQAVYTGMTRPLRKYGLDLTEATLKEYALKNGMDADIKSMSQAEKTMLRYQYVLENTKSAQGDFLRTADTWANQVKLLKQNFISLGTTIGSVFVNAFKPLLATLNKVLVAVNEFAVKVANALGNIFGWVYEGSKVGLLSETEDDASNLADDLGEADKNAKKLKNTIMGYDELNVMQEPKDSDSGSGSGASGSGSGADFDDSDLGKWRKKYESEIDNLFDLGRTIADKLQEMMEKIDWDSIYEKARGFGKGLADFLNGLFKPEMFYQIGRTIAGCLNTALHFLDSFAIEFDFEQFGLSIANGINGFFENFDFKLLANTIDEWVQGIFTTLKTAIENIKWDEVWDGIKDFISEIDNETILLIVGAWFTPKVLKFLKSSVLNKIAEAFGGSLLTAGGSILLTIEIALVIKNLIADVDKYKEAMGKDSFWDALLNGDRKSKREYAKTKASNPYARKDAQQKERLKDTTNILNSEEYARLYTPQQEDFKSLEEYKKAYEDFAKTYESKFGTSWFANLSRSIGEYKASCQDLNSLLNNSGNNYFDKYVKGANDGSKSIKAVREDIANLSKDTKSSTSSFSEWADKCKKAFDNAKTYISEWQQTNNSKREEERQKFNSFYEDMSAKFKAKYDEMGAKVKDWWTNDVSPYFTVEKWQSLWENVKTAFSNKWAEIKNWWKNTAINKWWEEDVKPWFSADKWNFSGIKEGLSQAFENAVAGMKEIYNRFANWVNEKLSFSWESKSIGGKEIIKGGSIQLGKLPTFASGGFPEDGLFMANHGELVGGFSNGKTAVANNEQITEGIKRAVIDGMMQVVMATSSNDNKDTSVNLYLDGRVIAQSTYNNLKTMSRQGVIPSFI